MLWLVLPAVLVGTVLQRICGTGVGLVVAPTFAVLLGGANGVFLTNTTTFLSGLLLTLALWRRVDWREWALICGYGLVGTIPGALLVKWLTGAVLQLVVGGVVLLAMAVILRQGEAAERRGPLVTAGAGAAAGLLNVTAGVAAPAVVMYSRVTRWNQQEYAATTQPIFMTLAVTSLGTKFLVGASHPASLPSAWLFAGILVMMLLGLWAGTGLARKVPAERARALALGLAGLGAVLAIVRGVLGLLG